MRAGSELSEGTSASRLATLPATHPFQHVPADLEAAAPVCKSSHSHAAPEWSDKPIIKHTVGNPLRNEGLSLSSGSLCGASDQLQSSISAHRQSMSQRAATDVCCSGSPEHAHSNAMPPDSTALHAVQGSPVLCATTRSTAPILAHPSNCRNMIFISEPLSQCTSSALCSSRRTAAAHNFDGYDSSITSKQDSDLSSKSSTCASSCSIKAGSVESVACHNPSQHDLSSRASRVMRHSSALMSALEPGTQLDAKPYDHTRGQLEPSRRAQTAVLRVCVLYKSFCVVDYMLF